MNIVTVKPAPSKSNATILEKLRNALTRARETKMLSISIVMVTSDGKLSHIYHAGSRRELGNLLIAIDTAYEYLVDVDTSK